MAFGDACPVRHAMVTEFDVDFVTNLVEAVVREELPVDEIEELYADICFSFHGVWGIEPGHISFSRFLAVW